MKGRFFTLSLLHVRGGVSPHGTPHCGRFGSSPRPWRCFSRKNLNSARKTVFSTSVEVFPLTGCSSLQNSGLLHVRGGVSLAVVRFDLDSVSSPRPWRCFQRQPHVSLPFSVFSTSVEVFLKLRYGKLIKFRLLHVRGGVSHFPQFVCFDRSSSPRPWRCFSAPDGSAGRSVGLLHVRGGVSNTTRVKRLKQLSSPRPWRCFHALLSSSYCLQVFSTSVEVFPWLDYWLLLCAGLLHVRGGVSENLRRPCR